MPYGLKINEYSHRQLCVIVDWVQSDTLLRTEDQLLTDVMRELGFPRSAGGCPRRWRLSFRASAAAAR